MAMSPAQVALGSINPGIIDYTLPFRMKDQRAAYNQAIFGELSKIVMGHKQAKADAEEQANAAEYANKMLQEGKSQEEVLAAMQQAGITPEAAAGALNTQLPGEDATAKLGAAAAMLKTQGGTGTEGQAAPTSSLGSMMSGLAGGGEGGGARSNKTSPAKKKRWWDIFGFGQGGGGD